MKHLITEEVVGQTFTVLYDCLVAGKTVTLKELTDGINNVLRKKGGVNELVIAHLLNTIYTHPNNQYTGQLQAMLKFAKTEISAMTVLCFEDRQSVYPRWLEIGNRSDSASLMRDRNNTLVLLRAKHMQRPTAKVGGDVPMQEAQEQSTTLPDQVLTSPAFEVGAKKEPVKLVSSLELRTVPIEKKPFDLKAAWEEATKGQVSPEHFIATNPHANNGSGHGKLSEHECPVVDQEKNKSDSDMLAVVYTSTTDSMLLGDYRNLAMQLVRAAIWDEPVTFETLCRDVGVSKGRLSDMVINIVETLPDTMHAGLLRNLLTFIEKPNGDVPYWWSTSNTGSSEEDVRTMRKYVADGLSGQWHQLMQSHKDRIAKAAENNLVKFRCVEATVKSVLANILLAKGSSQFDIQSIMSSSVKEWDKGSGSTISQGSLEQTVFKSVSIIVWLDKVNNLPGVKKTGNEVAVTMEQNAYTQYGESGTWFYREFPVPHSVSIVEK